MAAIEYWHCCCRYPCFHHHYHSQQASVYVHFLKRETAVVSEVDSGDDEEEGARAAEITAVGSGGGRRRSNGQEYVYQRGFSARFHRGWLANRRHHSEMNSDQNREPSALTFAWNSHFCSAGTDLASVQASEAVQSRIVFFNFWLRLGCPQGAPQTSSEQ